MNSGEWLERQLAMRLAGACREVREINAQVLRHCGRWPRMAVLDAGVGSYLSVNGYDQLSPFDDHARAFTSSTPAGQGRAKGPRQADFANLVMSWRLGGRYLTNWCDAAGADYAGTGLSVPVLQFVRRRAQRGQVVLFPVDKLYSGIGCGNLPAQLEDIPFRAKRDRVTWRGRPSGTWCDWVGGPQFWSQSVFGSPMSDAADTAHAREVMERLPRIQVCQALSGAVWADVGLTLNRREQLAMAETPWLGEMLRPFVRPHRDRREQLRDKFILAVPGNDIASGLHWALMSNSVVLMVENDWETALELGLEPWVHYVPVAPTIDSIGAAFETLLSDPDRCEAIIACAQAHMAPLLDADLRDRLDWLTLRAYEAGTRSTADLRTNWSVARQST